VSFGNGADLRETELLEYFRDDPETQVIAVYLEGVDNGRAFLSMLKDVAARKPVVINKGGLSEAGSRAVESHTASLGGSSRIWEAVIRQCGAVQVGDLWEMAEACLAFSLLPPRAYENITVAGGGGALGVSACDTAEAFGLKLPMLDPGITEAILSVLPRPGSSARNPIDAANPFVGPDAYREIFLKAAEDPRIDLQVLVQLVYHYQSLSKAMGVVSVKDVVPYRELAQVSADVAARTGKPIVLVLPNIKQGAESMDIEDMNREMRDTFLGKGIPVYDDIKKALRAIGHVSRYYARRARTLR
jgi:acyl-CoA synthetase (NDP forming)